MSGRRIVIVSDTSLAHTNGVLTTFIETVAHLKQFGHSVIWLTSDNVGSTKRFPWYQDLRCVMNPWKVKDHLLPGTFDSIHICTEGPLGLTAARHCVQQNIAFTSSYHTKLPEYVNQQISLIPVGVVYKFMSLTHARSQTVLVNTESLRSELKQRGFHDNIQLWGRGVNTQIFHPIAPVTIPVEFQVSRDHKKLLYVGRVAAHKNLEAFLSARIANAYKFVIGTGPQLLEYKKKYQSDSSIVFLGEKSQSELQPYYVSADVFVFPSQTDTLGLVMLEAMTCGTPVAAFSITGPIDVVSHGINGYLCSDLSGASDSFAHTICQAMSISRQTVARMAEQYSWVNETRIFEACLVPATVALTVKQNVSNVTKLQSASIRAHRLAFHITQPLIKAVSCRLRHANMNIDIIQQQVGLVRSTRISSRDQNALDAMRCRAEDIILSNAKGNSKVYDLHGIRLEPGDYLERTGAFFIRDYKHVGVYIGDGCLIEVNGPPRDPLSLSSLRRGVKTLVPRVFGNQSGVVLITLQDFIKQAGSIKACRVVPIPEHERRDRETTVRLAVDCLGFWDYNALLRNCEHFANWIVRGLFYSEQAHSPSADEES